MRHGVRLPLIVSLACWMLSSCALFPRLPAVRDYLPRETDVPGWELQRIDQIASRRAMNAYHPLCAAYGAEEAAVAVYRRLSDPDRLMRLDVVRFSSALDAFGVLSRERRDGACRFADETTCSSDVGIAFRAGRYYVKVSSAGEFAADQKDVEWFAAAASQNLSAVAGANDLPASASLLTNGSYRDVTYFKEGVPAVPGIDKVFVVRRRIDGASRDLFYRKMRSAHEADSAFAGLLKKGYTLTKIGSIQPAVRSTGEGGYTLAVAYRRWIFGILNASSIEEGSRDIALLYGEIRIRTESRPDPPSQ